MLRVDAIVLVVEVDTWLCELVTFPCSCYECDRNVGAQEVASVL